MNWIPSGFIHFKLLFLDSLDLHLVGLLPGMQGIGTIRYEDVS